MTTRALWRDDLVVLWYEKGDYGADWPHVAMRYTPKWPETSEEGLEKIVIASQTGSEVYDQDFLPDSHRNITIYSQENRSIAGFNPNEEHALIGSSNTGSGFLTVYALRNDLGHADWADPQDYTSEPYVLVKYEVEQLENPGNWLWQYRVFVVEVESDAVDSYPAYRLVYGGEVGNIVQPPVPISRLLPMCNGASYAEASGPFWSDRNGKIWARHGGVGGHPSATGTVRWFYPLQEGFYYDCDGNGEQDAGVTDCIPWLDHNPNTTPDTPLAVTYAINWPEDTPVLCVGETLFTPKQDYNGNYLPDIMNQCSVSIVFDEPNEINGMGPAVKLIDPLSERRVHLAALPAEINTRLQSGKTVFVDLPYHLRRRVYYDSVNEKLVFTGAF